MGDQILKRKNICEGDLQGTKGRKWKEQTNYPIIHQRSKSGSAEIYRSDAADRWVVIGSDSKSDQQGQKWGKWGEQLFPDSAQSDEDHQQLHTHIPFSHTHVVRSSAIDHPFLPHCLLLKNGPLQLLSL